jgi:hypothetical protein
MARKNTRKIEWDIVLAWVMIAAAIGAASVLCLRGNQASGAEPQLGTVLISRNVDESLNTSPGHWNHLAIYVGEGSIVESQEGKGVILTPLVEYVERKYEWAAIYPVDPEVGKRAAEAAKELVGLPYRKLGTGMRRVKQGLNCVGTIVVAESKAIGRKVSGFRIPDQALLQRELFKGVEPESPSVPDLEPAPQWQPMAAGFELPAMIPGVEHFMVSGVEVRMAKSINAYRYDRELRACLIDPVLMEVARARVSIFAHNHPRFGWVNRHARSAGFDGFATDNLAQGYPTPEDAVGDSVSGWGDERRGHSVGHDMQMKGYAKINGRWINKHFDRLGVAQLGRNYIAIFGRLD